MLRTHTCGELRLKNKGKSVTLAGWVHRRRDHGGLIFIDIRDRWGLTQLVFDPATSKKAHKTASKMRAEYVIRVEGEVVARPEGLRNPDLATGDIEVRVESADILNEAQTPPFYISEEAPVEETLRLKYRYLDLRRKRMQDNLALRHRLIGQMRRFLDERGFMEMETPILIKSTPEGARDYLVPSRIHPGRFYALPQSPQQLKQLLMVAGFDRYYQIARCFRDEDLRADRQPEFTQLDVEMSFVEQEDILRLIEELVIYVVESVSHKRLMNPFPRLTYEEAIEKYGSDKPDLRFGMELTGLSDALRGTEFGVFAETLASGGVVKGIKAPGCAKYSRKEMDELTALVQAEGAKGLVSLAVEDKKRVRSPVAKHLSKEEIESILSRFQAQPADLLLLVAGECPVVNAALNRLRLEIGSRLGLRDENLLAFAWVVNMPLFEWKEAEKRWDAMHHPFTAPRPEDIPLLKSNPGAAKAQQYDLVCNDAEIGGGSIRIHRREIQEFIFEIMGLSRDTVQSQFGHLLGAFEYGTPPHGGIALGLDRLVAILAGESSIREVIAFPKTQSAMDLVFGAPSSASEEQLKELHLRTDAKE